MLTKLNSNYFLNPKKIAAAVVKVIVISSKFSFSGHEDAAYKQIDDPARF